MNRIYRMSRGCVGGVLLVVIACESPGATASERISDDITLTAEDPVAAFEVRLCVTEDAPTELEGDGSFYGHARVNEGSAELTLENLAVDPDYVGPGATDDPIDVVSLSDSPSSISVILTMRLDGLSSGQCSETQVVQFSVDDLAEAQTVTIHGAEAFFGGQWATSLCGSELTDSSMRLEVERI